jgi:small neutral amino acid transporter SnatA (MarC family)
MRERILKLEKYSLVPSFLAALVLFVSLSTIIPPGANLLLSAIVSVFAFPIIFVFCLFGCALLINFGFQSMLKNYFYQAPWV